MRQRRPARPLLGAAVLAAHVLIVLGLAHIVTRTLSPSPSRVDVRLIFAPTLPAIVQPPVSTPTEAGSARRTANRSSPATSRHDVAPITHEVVAEPPTLPASAPPEDSLLDGDATRRAIRLTARRGGLAAQANDQVAVPSLTPTQQLPGAMREAAKGDCMKGEYPGGGMGLLSIPFLAAAVTTGNCAK